MSLWRCCWSSLPPHRTFLVGRSRKVTLWTTSTSSHSLKTLKTQQLADSQEDWWVSRILSHLTWLDNQQVTTARPQKFEEILPAIDDNYEDEPESFIVTATPRSFNVRRKGEQGRRNGGKEVLQLEPLTINSTPGNFRIIQPIQIVSTVSPPRWSINSCYNHVNQFFFSTGPPDFHYQKEKLISANQTNSFYEIFNFLIGWHFPFW